MKTFIGRMCICCILMNLSFSAFAGIDKTELTGKVTDKNTGEALPGATIFIPELKTGTTSDLNGIYSISNLPSKKILMQVNLIGYKTLIATVDLATQHNFDFQLEVSVKEINEVVITGSATAVERNRTPTPMAVVRKTELLQTASTNIIDALTSQPGISQVTTGSGISKPVIRGLGYNRVVVVNDNIRQEGQQWGDEHGIEIDEYGVDRVEILKGPASLAYGSDAMAGVINFISAPSPSEGVIHSDLITNYESNNGLFGYSINNSGNLHGFVWDARWSQKMAHAYKNKYDGYVFNSGFNEYNAQTILGFNKSWGYSHLHLSYYHLTPGIVEGERDSATGNFIKPVALNDSTETMEQASASDYKSYSASVPFQEINHFKAVLNNSIIIKDGTLKSTLGFQQNNRKEFADALNPNTYGLFFQLNTVNYEIKYHFPEIKKINLSAGVNGMYQESLNKGTEFLVPAYQLFDAGLFVIAARKAGDFDFSGGIRYDHRNVEGASLFLDSSGVASPEGTIEKFSGFKTNFSGFTGSLGFAWNFNPAYFAKANLSFGYRAPNIAELGANGIHEGTIRYEIGNPNLKAEMSHQIDLALGVNKEHLSIEFDVFSNTISNFVYLSKLSNSLGTDSIQENYSVFKYGSGNALLQGGEITIDIHPHPLDWLHFENSFSFVNATLKNQADSMKYLPFTPPGKFTSTIQLSQHKLGTYLQNAYFKIGAELYLDQNNVYSAYNTESATPSYLLFNAGIGTDFVVRNRTYFSIYLTVNNLTDVAYQSHLSRLKYGPENFASGRSGVYNMGRNISVKLLLPFDLKKAKG